MAQNLVLQQRPPDNYSWLFEKSHRNGGNGSRERERERGEKKMAQEENINTDAYVQIQQNIIDFIWFYFILCFIFLLFVSIGSTITRETDAYAWLYTIWAWTIRQHRERVREGVGRGHKKSNDKNWHRFSIRCTCVVSRVSDAEIFVDNFCESYTIKCKVGFWLIFSFFSKFRI